MHVETKIIIASSILFYLSVFGIKFTPLDWLDRKGYRSYIMVGWFVLFCVSLIGIIISVIIFIKHGGQ